MRTFVISDRLRAVYTVRGPKDGTWLQPPEALEVDVREVWFLSSDGRSRECRRLLRTRTLDDIEDIITEYETQF